MIFDPVKGRMEVTAPGCYLPRRAFSGARTLGLGVRVELALPAGQTPRTEERGTVVAWDFRHPRFDGHPQGYRVRWDDGREAYVDRTNLFELAPAGEVGERCEEPGCEEPPEDAVARCPRHTAERRRRHDS